MQLLNKIQGEYDQLWKYIIRPTRTPYPDAALGPETFCLQNIKIKRNSFQLINDRGQVFFGSHFVPLELNSYPCVIYLHGNSSNQTEGMQYLSELIKNNISICTFDFCGCGNSQGQYVTLGYNEWKDLEEVYMHIKAKQKVTKIGLWGRSMGAVTALRFTARHPQIAVSIYDSPFKSLKSLIGDLCKKNTKIPMIILSGALKIISSTIKQKANFDIYQLDPLKNEAPTIKVPGFFIVSEQDQLIPAQHSKLLFQAYKSKKKQIRVVKGEHNGTRPEACIKDSIKFLKKYLFKRQSQQKSAQSGVGGVKIQQVDFFNDEFNQNQISNSIETTTKTAQSQKDIDFFSFEIKNDKEMQKIQKQLKEGTQQKNSQNSNSLLSSLNEMFAGVFRSQKVKRPHLTNDGYEDMRSRILTSVGNTIGQKSKNQKQRQMQLIIEQEIKVYDDGFEKMFVAEPSLFTW